MNPALEAVLKAWTNPGTAVPGYHRAAQQELMRMWPTLALALDELAAAAEEGEL